MGLVSPVSEGMPVTRTVGVYFFHVGILCYPIVYIACLILSITRLVVKKPYAVLYALLPIFYICFVVVFSILLLTQSYTRYFRYSTFASLLYSLYFC